MVSIKVLGVASSIIFLKGVEKAKEVAIEKAIKDAGFFIEGEVKESIAGHRAESRSVDTGRFLNSPTTSFPGKFTAKIESNLDYARTLEFSPNILGGPRSHFRNTAKRNEHKVKGFIEKAVK